MKSYSSPIESPQRSANWVIYFSDFFVFKIQIKELLTIDNPTGSKKEILDSYKKLREEVADYRKLCNLLDCIVPKSNPEKEELKNVSINTIKRFNDIHEYNTGTSNLTNGKGEIGKGTSSKDQPTNRKN